MEKSKFVVAMRRICISEGMQLLTSVENDEISVFFFIKKNVITNIQQKRLNTNGIFLEYLTKPQKQVLKTSVIELLYSQELLEKLAP